MIHWYHNGYLLLINRNQIPDFPMPIFCTPLGQLSSQLSLSATGLGPVSQHMKPSVSAIPKMFFLLFSIVFPIEKLVFSHEKNGEPSIFP